MSNPPMVSCPYSYVKKFRYE